MTILFCGGAGFIGTNLTNYWLETRDEPVIVLDKLNYAGVPPKHMMSEHHVRFHFIHGDITDSKLVCDTLEKFAPDTIINLAAESHVDNAISDADPFIKSNIVGTYELLKATFKYWKSMPNGRRKKFQFVQVSTDEVFGSLANISASFDEKSPYQPSNPYSASKASADHLVTAYNKTFGLPTIILYFSNNYGPFQHKEKFIPKLISNAFKEVDLPIYGHGKQHRNWLHVYDTCEAIASVVGLGKSGQRYSFGGMQTHSNIEIAKKVCQVLDTKFPRLNGQSYTQLIRFVKDRPGHDFCYKLDNTKALKEFGWSPKIDLIDGLEHLVEWLKKTKC